MLIIRLFCENRDYVNDDIIADTVITQLYNAATLNKM